MPYTVQITRKEPTAFVLLIDQSESMQDPVGVPVMQSMVAQQTKADAAAEAVNRVLENLRLRCTKGPNDIRDYFYVGVVGYGPGVNAALPADATPGELPALVPISQLPDLVIALDERQKEQVDERGNHVVIRERFPVYVPPVAANGTPMCQALHVAFEMLDPWVTDHPNTFPPVVINITDGEASDGDPRRAALEVRGLATSDGFALLFNCHLSSFPASAVVFPDNERDLADEYARQLFQMSSVLPGSFQQAAAQLGYRDVGPQTRGFAFNADLGNLVQFLNVGTRGAKGP